MSYRGGGSYSSRYSAYNKYSASTRISQSESAASSRSSYQRQTVTEYENSRGVSKKSSEVVASDESRSLPVFVAVRDYRPEGNDKDALPLDEGQIVEVLDNKNAAAWLVRTKARPPQTGWVPGSYFETPTEYYKQRRNTREITAQDLSSNPMQEALQKRDQVFLELMKSEEEYVAELRHVIENYINALDEPTTPMDLRGLRDQLFLNFRDLYNFHANVLLKGLQYYSDDPDKVGQTFVRLERDFDHHVRYCKDIEQAEKFLDIPKVRDFFQKIEEQVEEEDSENKLSDYLKLPVKRLSQYQQSIKELMKYATRAGKDTKSLERALEMLLGLPQRATDLSYIRNIQGLSNEDGKLGRLLRHEEFKVWEHEKEGDGSLLYAFLFKSKLLLTQKTVIDEDEPPEFQHRATIKLDKYELSESRIDDDVFILSPADKASGLTTYYIRGGDLRTSEYHKHAWVKDIKEAKDHLERMDESEETETVTEFADMSDVKSEFSEYSTVSRKSSELFGDDGPPKKRIKSPPQISPSESSASLYSSTLDLKTFKNRFRANTRKSRRPNFASPGNILIRRYGASGTTSGTGTLEMQGNKITRTQYGFRTFQESSAKMCLKVAGYPLPQITWFKDGVLLEKDGRRSFYEDDDGFFSLTIDPVLVEDTGRYSCVATNEYGQASTEAFFRVLKSEQENCPPAFKTSPLERVEISEGETVTLNCEVEGWPEPEIMWYNNGDVIHPSQDFKIAYDGQSCSLTIRDAQAEDSGTYRVTISNEHGSQESKTVLTIKADPEKLKVAPDFQLELVDVECNEGDTVKFKAMITGDPAPDVNWLVNGIQLTAASNISFTAEDGIYILEIRDITPHFDGEVICKATNRLGEISSKAKLRVHAMAAAPGFIKELEDTKIIQSESIRMEVKVSGNPSPSVAWFKNGEPLLESRDVRLTAEENGVFALEIPRAHADHSGLIECRATNEYGESSTSAHLSVKKYGKSKPEFQTQLSQVEVNEGDTLRAKLLISGDPEPRAKWYIGDRLVVETEDVELTAEDGVYVLAIHGASKDMEGQLKCVAYNKFGETSCSTNIKVSSYIPVEFEQFLSDATCYEGDTLKLRAVLIGEPAPEVTWYANGRKLEDNHSVSIFKQAGTYMVVIKNITVDYSGEILCRAVNEYGEASSSAQLTVLPRGTPPDFTEWLSNVSVREGSKVHLKVVFTGDPIPLLTWSVNDEPIPDGKSDKFLLETSDGVSTLTILSFTRDMVGKVICKAENDAGEVSCTAQMELARVDVEVSEHSELEAMALSMEEEIGGDEAGTDTDLSFQEESVATEKEETKTESMASTGEPKFIRKLESTKVKKGHKAHFECEVPDSRGIVVKWYKDGNEIELVARIKVTSKAGEGETRFHALSIDKVTEADTGEYTVSLQNKYGVQTSTARLEIEEALESEADSISEVAPFFSKDLEQTYTAMVGYEVCMECKAEGFPRPSVEWFKDGQKLRTSKYGMKKARSVKVEASEDGVQRLSLPEAKEADAGVYECVISSKLGSATTKAALIMESIEKVIIDEQLESEKEVAPHFVKPLKEVRTEEGSNVTLECGVAGKPTPSIQWLRDGQKLDTNDHRLTVISLPDGTQKLEISHCQEHDAAKYTCSAINRIGEVTSDARLEVCGIDKSEEAAPEFIKVLHSCTVNEKGKAVLECQVRGSPQPSIQWFKGDEVLKPSHRFEMEQHPDGTIKLTIFDAECGDTGEYRCEATNDLGTAWTESPLMVKVPTQTTGSVGEIAPDFEKPLQAAIASEGECVTLTCKVTGVPSPDVKWYQNGQIVKGGDGVTVQSWPDGTQTLTFDNAQVSDTAEFRCEAENVAGTTWSDATLEVKGAEPMDIQSADETAPQFTQDLTECRAEEGTSVSLECKVEGKPKPEVKWFKDGAEVQLSENIEMVSEANGIEKLLIHHASGKDEGNYKVEARNVVGEVSSKAPLTVHGMEHMDMQSSEETAPRFTQDIKECRAEEGTSVSFECKVEGQPKPEVKWFKDGAEIELSENIEMVSEDDGTERLLIHHASAKDQGNYRVEATNMAGETCSKAPLTVQLAEDSSVVAPEFSVPLQECKADEGSTAKLECAVSGLPLPNVTWYKEGVEVVQSEHIQIQSWPDGKQALIILDAHSEDIGQYYCVATNSVGKAESKAQVSVSTLMPKPEFTQGLKSVRVNEGSTVTMSCSVATQPNGICPEVKWYKDDLELGPSAHITMTSAPNGECTLTVSYCTMADAGQYSCVASNSAGTAKTEAAFTVIRETKETPEAPAFNAALGDVTVSEGEPLELHVNISGKPFPAITWYKDGEVVSPSINTTMAFDENSGDARLTIAQATHGDEGVYRCTLKNEGGSESSRANVTVEEKKAPLSFKTGLHDDEVRPKSTARLEAQIEGSPKSVKWYKDGKKLSPGPNIKMVQTPDGYCSLMISDFDAADCGKYSISAENEAGSIASEATLSQFGSKPSIEQQLRDQSVEVGAKLLLQVQVSGDAEHVHWYKDGQKVVSDGSRVTVVEQDGEKYSLLIYDAKVADTGLYKVVVANSFGDVESEGTVSVSIPPGEPMDVDSSLTISEGLQSKKCKEGEKIQLSAVVDGKPKVVKWYKNGRAIIPDGKRIRTEEDGSKNTFGLIITSAELDDAAEYKVEFSNDLGTVASEARVEVAAKGEPMDVDTSLTISEGLQSKKCKEGEKIQLSAVVDGKPKVVKWYKNGRAVISDGKRVRTEEDGSKNTFGLIITSAELDDAAEYKVEFSNDLGTVASEARVEVAPKGEKPSMRKGLADQNIDENDDLKFEVELDGSPASIKFFKNGSEIKPDGDRIKVIDDGKGHAQLIVTGAKETDAAVYKVVATNEFGEDESAGIVRILPRKGEPMDVDTSLTLRKGLSDVKCKQGDAIELSVEVEGKPRSVKWYKNGREVKQDGKRVKVQETTPGNFSLTISPVETGDAGKFSVELSNEKDSVSSEAVLEVKASGEVPQFKKGLSDQALPKGAKASLEVEVEGKPVSVKWFKGNQELKPSQNVRIESDAGLNIYRLILDNVDGDTCAEYTVVAENEAGQAESCGKLELELEGTQQPVFKKGLSDKSAPKGSQVILEVEIEGLPKKVKWFKGDEELKAGGKMKIEADDERGIYRLILDDIENESGGQYTVIAENDKGQAWSSGSILVEDGNLAPKILRSLSDQVVVKGQNSVFEVEIGNKPKEVKWYRNKRLLTPSSSVKPEKIDEKTYRLTISSCTENDEGTYKVEASNEYGDVSSEATLRLKEKSLTPTKGEDADVAATIVLPLKDCAVPEGAAGELTCKIAGNPQPEVLWYKDNVPLKDNERFQSSIGSDGTAKLKIADSQTKDAGLYKCVVKNKLGQDQTECKMTVESTGDKLAPEILQPLSDQIVVKGQDSVFEVKISNKPKEIKWYRNGRLLTPTSTVKPEKIDEKTYRLTVGPCSESDEGTYKVEASNDYGDVSSEATLRLKDRSSPSKGEDMDVAATIVLPLKDCTVPEGAAGELTCKVAGNPQPEVLWYKDNVPLKDNERFQSSIGSDGTAKLRIADSQTKDAGIYKCVVKNKLGQDQTECKMTVESTGDKLAPEILQPLSDQIVVKGQNSVFEVKIANKPKEIKWYRNGRLLSPTSTVKPEKIDEKTYRLTIGPCNESDEGTYKVEASNDYGDVFSEATLRLKDRSSPRKGEDMDVAATIVLPLKDCSLPEGKTANLICKVAGTPWPEVLWYKDGTLLEDTKKWQSSLHPDGTATLKIVESQKEDSGRYKCVVRNQLGQDQTECSLTVTDSVQNQVAPKFVIPLRDAVTTEGKDVSLDIKIRGFPQPEFTWMKDNVELKIGDRIRLEDLGENRWRLTIKNACLDDDGVYSCTIENSLGNDTSKGELTVNSARDQKRGGDTDFAPKFTVPLHDRIVPEGHQMIVECFVSAQPKATIKWYGNGTELRSDERLLMEELSDGKCRLSILRFLQDDVAQYRCVAENALGTATTKAKLGVQVLETPEEQAVNEFPPKFITELGSQTVKRGTPITLQCQVDGLPKPTIKWYKDGIGVKINGDYSAEYLDDGVCMLHIRDTLPEHEGTYRCVASNPHGSSNTSGFLTVLHDKPEAKQGGSAPVFVIPLRDTSVEKGTTLVLKCAVEGQPFPVIKWYKDGVPVRKNNRTTFSVGEDGACTLTVTEATLSDEGLYRCLAENEYGTLASLGAVTVEVPREKQAFAAEEGEAPIFTVPFHDVESSLGSSVELECKVSGKPMPQLKWSKDGNPLKPNHRILISPVGNGRYRMTITELREGDEGTYRCVATNDAGSATTKANITCGQPLFGAKPEDGDSMPRFILPLYDTRITEGEPLRLECKVDGSPSPQLQWYKDGEPLLPSDRIRFTLEPDGTSRLCIDQCTLADDGLYRCVATNPLGSANTKGKAAIRPKEVPKDTTMRKPDDFAKERAPYFSIPLDSIRCEPGSTITFSCRVIGVPFPDIKWFKDGERLYPFGRYDMRQLSDGTLQLCIRDLQDMDAGAYRCVADNGLGSARTTAQLTLGRRERREPLSIRDEMLLGKAPGFVRPLTVCRVREGKTAVMECEPYGDPFPTVKWLKDGMELVSSERIRIESLENNVQRLIIDEVLFRDDGFYRCVIANEHGLASTKAELIVESDPAKRKSPDHLSPKDRFLQPLKDEQMDTSPKPPRFRRGLRNVTVTQGSPATFECAISGFPKPTVTWWQGDKELRSDDLHMMWTDEWGYCRLVILNTKPSDEGPYRCEIKNEHGSAESEAQLTVLKDKESRLLPDLGMLGGRLAPDHGGKESPPGFLKQLRNKYIMGFTPAIFDCIVCGNPAPTVEWYHNQKKIEPDSDRIRLLSCGGGSFALILLRSMPEDQGEYVCVAKNHLGSASSSAVLEVAMPFENLRALDFDSEREMWHPDDLLLSRIPYSGIPSPPNHGPFISEVTSHHLNLSWIPTLRPPPRYPQITYVVEMRELPDKDWAMIDYNISQPVCRIRNLDFGRSYQFRVRAENIYGISDPSPASPPSMLMAPPQPVLDRYGRPIPLMDPYAEDAIEKAYAEQYACAPWFSPEQSDRAYCAIGGTLDVTLWVYGFPDPQVQWHLRGWPVETALQGRAQPHLYRGTEAVLKIMNFKAEDAGQYQCMAVNDHGEAQQNVFVELAEHPTFLQVLENKTLFTGNVAKLDCRVDGKPFPKLKWLKDWRPIAESSRIKIVFDEPYRSSLIIKDTIMRDTGVYTCVATNPAGKTTSSATLTVEAEPMDVDIETLQKALVQKPRRITEMYTIETVFEEDEEEEEEEAKKQQKEEIEVNA